MRNRRPPSKFWTVLGLIFWAGVAFVVVESSKNLKEKYQYVAPTNTVR